MVNHQQRPVVIVPEHSTQEQSVLLTCADLQRRFRASRGTIFNWRKKRGLPYVLIKGDKNDALRFKASEVKAWAQANQLGHLVLDL